MYTETAGSGAGTISNCELRPFRFCEQDRFTALSGFLAPRAAETSISTPAHLTTYRDARIACAKAARSRWLFCSEV